MVILDRYPPTLLDTQSIIALKRVSCKEIKERIVQQQYKKKIKTSQSKSLQLETSKQHPKQLPHKTIYYLFITRDIINKVSTKRRNFVENSRIGRTTTTNLQLFNRFRGVASRKLRIHNNFFESPRIKAIPPVPLPPFNSQTASFCSKMQEWKRNDSVKLLIIEQRGRGASYGVLRARYWQGRAIIHIQ